MNPAASAPTAFVRAWKSMRPRLRSDAVGQEPWWTILL